jgi:hypothetical protein
VVGIFASRDGWSGFDRTVAGEVLAVNPAARGAVVRHEGAQRGGTAKENDMPRSTLDRTGEQPPVINKGHGTEALGPSDSSDSGSDLRGGRGPHAGPDLGDANLDSDTDKSGTGERAAAGRDIETDRDLRPDHVETTPEKPREDRSHFRRRRTLRSLRRRRNSKNA